MDSFKRCPKCGKRFVVKRVSKSLIDRETGILKEEHLAGSFGGGPKSYSGGAWAVVEDDVPVEYDRYVTNYTCKSCHHKWSVTDTNTRRT